MSEHSGGIVQPPALLFDPVGVVLLQELVWERHWFACCACHHDVETCGRLGGLVERPATTVLKRPGRRLPVVGMKREFRSWGR